MTRRARAYHHGHLREAVLDEAVALVDDGEPLGLRELGRRLGVSHAAVHHHFPSVDGLARELAARWFVDLDAAMAAAVAELPPARTLERFRALGVAYVRYAIDHPHRYRLQFRGGTLEHDAGLVPEADASFRRVLDAVVACVPAASRKIDPVATTTLAWSAMHGLATLWLDGAFRKHLGRRADIESPGFARGRSHAKHYGVSIDALAARIAQLISQLLE